MRITSFFASTPSVCSISGGGLNARNSMIMICAFSLSTLSLKLPFQNNQKKKSCVPNLQQSWRIWGEGGGSGKSGQFVWSLLPTVFPMKCQLTKQHECVVFDLLLPANIHKFLRKLNLQKLDYFGSCGCNYSNHN